jgi:HAD superfamily hydrolase (TIGR01509 family)
MDGVIVDSEIWWDEVRSTFAAANRKTWTADDQAAVMGANSPGWARIMRERLGLEMSEPAIERTIVDGVAERYRREGAPLIDGAIEAIRRIATTMPVAIASSSHAEVIDEALAATGLGDVFTVVVSSDEVAHGKPAPDVYLEAARRLGLAPAACLVVEDSYNGVRAGKAAGMFVVLVPNRSVPPAPGTSELADLVLDELADLAPGRIDPVGPGSAAGGTGPAAGGPG